MGESLWGTIDLGEWSAEDLFALFQARRDIQLADEDFNRMRALRGRATEAKAEPRRAKPLSAAEAAELARLEALDRGAELPPTDADRFARLMMQLIQARFRQHDFFVSLPKRGLEPADVAQSVLEVVVRRTKRMRLRHPCHRVLLENLHQLIRCAALDQMRRQAKRTICATDYASEQINSPGDPIDHGFAIREPAADLREIEARLLALEDEITGDLVADPEAVSRAYRVAITSILHNTPILLGELPAAMGKICEDSWAIIRVRIVRAIEGSFRGDAVPPWVQWLPAVQRTKWTLLFELLGEAAPGVAHVAAAALGGEPIQLPALHEVNAIERQRLITRSLSRDPSTEAVGRLASILGTDKREISKLFGSATGTGLQDARRLAI